ncbi:S-adenosyl-L-methionine-dependent methyltransferase [Triangularia setosa]|uniref:S-adenosyl-L-methionine-dependent methyltransferase n=1 Tax=Triangularia setosa TaxID=2587417 RepID=A0AAN7ABN0_9PEZI|nr:S-adenosyl-L-methionine-dependent methyltransferase [Podospora setosa]
MVGGHLLKKCNEWDVEFVPLLSGKILEWLDPQPDDHILDLGCGDGILDVVIAKVLVRGQGTLHGIDSSPSMVVAARDAVQQQVGLRPRCIFSQLDITKLLERPDVAGPGQYTKVFSNAVLHWVLAPPAFDSRQRVFEEIKYCLKPGGTFVFEMGGMGNIAEARAIMLSVVARKIRSSPEEIYETWFFPDEAWIRDMLEVKVGEFVIEKIETEWRPTKIDGEEGLYGWVKLVGGQLFGLISEDTRREEAIEEVVRLLEIVCKRAERAWGQEAEYVMNYVRLRVVARKL